MVNGPLIKYCLSMKRQTLGTTGRLRETGLQFVAHELLNRLTRSSIEIRAFGTGKQLLD